MDLGRWIDEKGLGIFEGGKLLSDYIAQKLLFSKNEQK